jgi:hypothetical protein
MNIPSTGNSGEKNRKWPRLSLLATATLLLSVISFIGVGGAIPQPQQAFAQTVDQSIDQKSNQDAEAGPSSSIIQDIDKLAEQGAFVSDDGSVSQEIDQESNQDAEAGEGSEVLQFINELGSQFTNATGED